jgi:hypothetical protein
MNLYHNRMNASVRRVTIIALLKFESAGDESADGDKPRATPWVWPPFDPGAP